MSNSVCYFNKKDFVITYKCNVLMLSVVLKLILVVIIVIVCILNHDQSRKGVHLGKETPLCSGNLPENREQQYAKEADG